MVSVTLELGNIENAVEGALLEATLYAVDKIVEVTPRDPKRLPNDPSAPVTGDLKRSIGYKKLKKDKYVVGVRGTGQLVSEKLATRVGIGTPVEEYAYYQEYGTKNVPARSYIRKTLIERGEDIKRVAQEAFNRLIK